MTWYDDNAQKAYPLTGNDDFGVPPDILVDALVYAPEVLGTILTLRSISVTPLVCSVVLSIDGVDVAYATRLQAQMPEYATIQLTPLVAGVSGFVVFGEGIRLTALRVDGPYTFLPECLIRYPYDATNPTVTVGGHVITGLVKLQVGAGMSITRESLRIRKEDTSIVTTDCALVSIDDDRLKVDAIPAGMRPAEGSPDVPPIASIEGVEPDTDGDIAIVIENILERPSDPIVAITGVTLTDGGQPCE